MDPVRRLQLVRALIQLDDQQNIVALQHQHQQVIHQHRLRRQLTMVVSTVVAETTSIWAIRASYGGNED